jgi:hypothetical protein
MLPLLKIILNDLKSQENNQICHTNIFTTYVRTKSPLQKIDISVAYVKNIKFVVKIRIRACGTLLLSLYKEHGT